MGRHVACSVRAVAAPVRGIYMVLSVFCLGQNTVIFWSSGTVCELNLLSYKKVRLVEYLYLQVIIISISFGFAS